MAAAPLLSQLEMTLRQLLQEHAALLRQLDAHESALRSCSLERIEKATREQDIVRQRIAQVESRRRVLTHQLARQHRSVQSPTLATLADLYPDRKLVLIGIRGELAELSEQIQRKSMLVGRIAQSVLGHVNATLRLVANAAAGPGAYTRSGTAPLDGRMGVLNAVA